MITTAESPTLPDIDLGIYDPDEVLPKNSPLMKAHRPKLAPASPSPPPAMLQNQVSPSFVTGHDSKTDHGLKIHRTKGDAVLIYHMDDGKRTDIAAAAAMQSPGPYEDVDDDSSLEGSDSDGNLESDDDRDRPESTPEAMSPLAQAAKQPRGSGSEQATDLQSLAVDALRGLSGTGANPAEPPRAAPPAAVAGGSDVPGNPKLLSSPPAPPGPADHGNHVRDVRDEREHREMYHEDAQSRTRPRSAGGAASSTSQVLAPPMSSYPYLVHPDPYPAREPSTGHGLACPDLRSPTDMPGTGRGEAKTTLPSIWSRLPEYSNKPVPDQSQRRALGPHQITVPGAHTSPPPIPQRDPFRQSMLSPSSATIPSPFSYPPSSGGGTHHRLDYSNNNMATPNSDSASYNSPVYAGSISERMSIDSVTNPPHGGFRCTVCNAPPFATQYLLNSHANVHSESRPHYCPEKGCPRSEGGKGFKRKNEMIRHGLVHTSPGYVCPFCPEREHRYPRPDNLQRHVRVHHGDRDKDDPKLREVLSQRPHGPNRGRRRRGGP